MTTETAQSNEDRVRKVWITTESGQVGFILRIQGWDTEADAWAAAWEYTETALEEVRQLKAELDRLDIETDAESWREWAHERAPEADQEYVRASIRGHATECRTVARLQSILAAKTAGMKPEAL